MKYLFLKTKVSYFLYLIKLTRWEKLILCKNFYDSNEIENSKGLIFQIYGKEEEIINRKGTNKISSDIQEIIKLVRSNLPPENIKLCITACTRLPPVTLDHIDDVTLVKQVVDLRL